MITCKKCNTPRLETQYYKSSKKVCKFCRTEHQKTLYRTKTTIQNTSTDRPETIQARKARTVYKARSIRNNLGNVRKKSNRLQDREFYVIDSVFENKFYITFPELNENSDNLWNDIDQWLYNEEDVIDQCIESAKKFEKDDQRYFTRKKYYDKKYEKDFQDDIDID